MQAPIIEALKAYKTNFNVRDLISLPPDTPYGNLNLTYMQIVIRIEVLNEAITELYDGFFSHMERTKANHGSSNLDEGLKHKFQIEQVIYWLRKTADELISILSVLYNYKALGNYPDKVPVPSIGKFLNLDKREYFNLEGQVKLFNVLNDISNAYKHTLINAQISNYVGRDEPVVFALSAYNQANVTPNFHQVSLKAILDEYNQFLLIIRSELESNYQMSVIAYKPYETNSSNQTF